MNQDKNVELKADDYAGILTVFGVLLAVEYASGAYDLWDVFIGILCLVIGRHYINTASQHRKTFYSFLTGCLLGLGWVGIASGIGGIVLLLFGKENLLREYAYLIEQGRFVIFIFLSTLLMKLKVTSRYTPNIAN